MTSIIRVSSIYVEDLFKWFHQHTLDSCGDGVGTIVCRNYKEVSEYFLEWFQKNIIVKIEDCKYKQYLLNNRFYHPKDEYENIINFHDMNENFMFTNQVPKVNFDYDYVFICEKDCYSPKKDWKVEGIL